MSGFGRKSEAPRPAPPIAPVRTVAAPPPVVPPSVTFKEPYRVIRDKLFERINVSAAVLGGREKLAQELGPLVADIGQRERLRLTAVEQDEIVRLLLDDMFGLGPIEPLLADPTVSDILINGPDQIYVERRGRLELTPIVFRDKEHLTDVAQRIAAAVGRRVDESSPMVDARLADGSRVNVILAPLALQGACVSIRKFARHRITLKTMGEAGNMSPAMAGILEIAGRCRLNILISGGTGSGKTTLLNAISQHIDHGERVITIEDAAELQLQQPHVVRLETRPASIEGSGEVNQRELVRNALRMRPDRIILGETRGPEAFDVLQAMNTGHDGSMTTIHANTPRDALIRLENMVMMASQSLPIRAIRGQIIGALNLVVQIARMRDGVRRVTQISEVVGMEGETITLQDVFNYAVDTSAAAGEAGGRFVSARLKPHFIDRAAIYGLQERLQSLVM